MFWDKDSNDETNNTYGIFLRKFPKIIIYIWIQQSYFGRKQKYIWKRFYTVEKPLKYRATIYFIERSIAHRLIHALKEGIYCQWKSFILLQSQNLLELN